MGNGRVQPPDGLALLLSLWERPGEGASSIFTGREMRPVLLPPLPTGEGWGEGLSKARLLPDLSAVALAKGEPLEGGVLDNGFVEGHGYVLKESPLAIPSQSVPLAYNAW